MSSSKTECGSPRPSPTVSSYTFSPLARARPTTQPKRTRSKSPASVPQSAPGDNPHASDPRAAFLAPPRIQRGICRCFWL
ncbi:hypothetical protein ZWY2020_014832 [Hordeum vulgare]|nr:hypothetical protein ZWY2020_014832 [Hordeum vulgare]